MLLLCLLWVDGWMDEEAAAYRAAYEVEVGEALGHQHVDAALERHVGRVGPAPSPMTPTLIMSTERTAIADRDTP